MRKILSSEVWGRDPMTLDCCHVPESSDVGFGYAAGRSYRYGSSQILLINSHKGEMKILWVEGHYIWGVGGGGVRNRRIPNYVIKLCSLTRSEKKYVFRDRKKMFFIFRENGHIW